MTFDEIIAARRSIRRYTEEPVQEEALNAVLNAGRLAPSASNRQLWHFTVAQDAALRAALCRDCCDQTMVAEAPATLVVWAEADRNMRCGQSAASVDCSIALSFMMLKAAELGLGTCWLGDFKADAVARTLQLPEGAVVVAVTPLGHPAEQPAPRARKTMEEIAEIRC